MTAAATDIILLTHNRLGHLVATVEALEARTPEPIRLTVVDNASGPELRNWLAANRDRFHKIILRSDNEHVPAFQHGIDATTSDPYIVSDPDIVVPDQVPSWLARLHDLMERHRDFGLIGIGLDQANRPPVLDPEEITPDTVVGGEIVEAGVGTVMQMIRRDALVTPYRSDWRTCTDVRRAGWRVGWAAGIRGVHLGWDDYRLHPAHLAAKHLDYGVYREVALIERPPTLAELAVAGPAVARTRAAAIPDAAVLELTWSAPAFGAAVPGSVCLVEPDPAALPIDDDAAGAVVLVDPPRGHGRDLIAEAARVAAGMVVAIADLDAFDACTARELAPAGWSGEEAHGPGDVPLALAACAEREADIVDRLGFATLEDREAWLRFFSAGAFGTGRRRLWVWRPDVAGAIPERVHLDAGRAQAWRPVAAPAPEPPPRSPLYHLWKRADVVERARVRLAVRRRAVGARA